MDHIERKPHSRGKGLAVLGGLGLGALIMYLADPQAGRRRRARLRDQYVHASRKVHHGTDVALRDASHRATGIVATLRGWVRNRAHPVDDTILHERVRSALGRTTSHPHAVAVEVNDGLVTIKGMALSAEADAIVACAARVPGVKSVENRLVVHASPEHIPSLQGGVPRRGTRPELLQDNWSPAWRSLAGVVGAGLTVGGWIRGGLAGIALGAVGGGLFARAAANRDMKSILGVGDHCKGVVVQKTIHIDVSPDEVFRAWTVEGFPRWMSHVREVSPLGGNRHHWVVDGPAGVAVEWDSEITEMVQDEVIAWRSMPGSHVDNAGRVRFTPERGGTRVQVSLCYVPVGGVIGHAVAKALGSDPKSRMDDDLMRFKTMIESGHAPHDAAIRRRGGDFSGSVVRH